MLKNSRPRPIFFTHVVDRMSFLRPHILWLTVQLLGCAFVVAGEPVPASVETKSVDPLLAALPERNLPGLEELMRVGLENGPTILMRRWEAEQSTQNARIARSPMLPQASAWVNAGVIYEQRKDDPVPTRTIEALLYNVGVSQPLYHWGALSKGYEVGNLYRAISSRNLDETRRLLAVDLRRRYFNLVIATGALNLAQKNLADLERELEFAKKQVADGFAASTESGTVDAKIISVRLDIQRLAGERDTLARDFARITGVPVEKLPKPVAELPALPPLDAAIKALSGEENGLPSIALQNLNDYVQAEKLNYEIQKTRLRPKMGLSFSVNQDNRAPDTNQLGPKTIITSWNAFATVNWAIFDGYSSQAAQKAALARMRAYEADRYQTARLDADTRKANVEKLQLLWRQLQESEKSLSGARGGVAAAEKDVAAGWAPSSAIDDARRLSDASIQSTNMMRADFYTALASYLSDRGLDPALQLAPRQAFNR
ncbi:MAG: TolC family protein [Nibricoccus sp.]